MSLVYLLALPFLGSLIAAFMPTHARTAAASWAAFVSLICLLWVLLLTPAVLNAGILQESHRWIPSAGVNFSIRIDGFAWMFALLVTGIGTLVAFYARYYMSAEDPVPRFFSFFLAFMGAMLGVVLSGNLVQLVFFWELTSLFSFLLIGYWHHRKDARRGARMSWILTGAGGLALLGGVLILGHIVGSYELDTVLKSRSQIHSHALYRPMLILVLLGAFTKSAQFPFHFWLPRAMAAPTPVSAYLHSATMVKAGVFLLARLWPALAGSLEWFWLVSVTGLLTLTLGAAWAIFQNDLKGLLAYSTISHLGLITLLLGLSGKLAAVAAVFHILNHATFKASLFMAAGIIDHETGTRDINRLSGLYKAIPVTGLLAIVASAAMAGVPLLNGFLSKEMFFAETVDLNSSPWFEVALPITATIAGIFAVVYSLRFVLDVFFGPVAHDLPRTPHEPVRWMRIPIEVLVFICLLVGIFPQWSVGPLLELAAGPVVGGALPAYKLTLWHGFNKPLMMSLIALVAGSFLYHALHHSHWFSSEKIRAFWPKMDGARAFNAVLVWLDESCRLCNRLLSTRRLQTQMLIIVLTSFAAAGLALWPDGISWGLRERVPGHAAFALLWIVGATCALTAAWQAKYHRLTALILVGAVGLCVSLSFLWFSAPDLALTQLAVETVTTVLLLLGLRWLPKRVPQKNEFFWKKKAVRIRDLLLALAAGGGMAAVSFAVMTRSAPQSISPFFISQALPEGGGTNIVNVMLVDFRGFDTMGEISVLAIVALTIYALLRRFRPPLEVLRLPAQQLVIRPDLPTSDLFNQRTARDTALGYMLVPAVLVRLLMPLAVTIGAYLFVRGHNEPGGGFVAGLVVAIAFVTQYMVSGTQWAEAHLRLPVIRWIATGLALVMLTGMGAWLFGYPFLTSHMALLHLPWLGEIHVPSALFFDAGVFAVVVGSTLLILAALAHQSVRAHRRAEEEKSGAQMPQGAKAWK